MQAYRFPANCFCFGTVMAPQAYHQSQILVLMIAVRVRLMVSGKSRAEQSELIEIDGGFWKRSNAVFAL